VAIFRILEATARPGAIEQLSQMLVQQEREVVAGAPGIVFVQSLRSGDRVLAVSSWRSVEDMQRYLEQPNTGAFYAALPELLMGTPSVRTFEVIRPAADDGGAATPAEAGWRSE
jgi:quinol monooxygenase YgiN